MKSFRFQPPGDRCEFDRRQGRCVPGVCRNGGTCRELSGGGFRCECPAGGYERPYCTVTARSFPPKSFAMFRGLRQRFHLSISLTWVKFHLVFVYILLFKSNFCFFLPSFLSSSSCTQTEIHNHSSLILSSLPLTESLSLFALIYLFHLRLRDRCYYSWCLSLLPPLSSPARSAVSPLSPLSPLSSVNLLVSVTSPFAFSLSTLSFYLTSYYSCVLLFQSFLFQHCISGDPVLSLWRGQNSLVFKKFNLPVSNLEQK